MRLKNHLIIYFTDAITLFYFILNIITNSIILNNFDIQQNSILNFNTNIV